MKLNDKPFVIQSFYSLVFSVPSEEEPKLKSEIMSCQLKWLILIQLLLTEQALCRSPPPLIYTNTSLPETNTDEETKATIKADHPSPPASNPQPFVLSTGKPSPALTASENQDRVQSAGLTTSVLKAKLQQQTGDHFYIQGNISCKELLSASSVGDPLSSVFSQEVLGLAIVPVLVMAGCPGEAQTLVLKLYNLLGRDDADELLMEIGALMEEKMKKSSSAPSPGPPASDKDGEDRRHMEAVMFNIQQLAVVGEGTDVPQAHCEGWIRVNGTTLAGTDVAGATGRLEDAVNRCDSLGALCAGVTSTGPLTPGTYRAVLKKGSSIFPFSSPESESWIRQCRVLDDVPIGPASGQRLKRSPRRSCINKNEERVYSVVEWIPGVSTLYNLGTAVYYASVNCSATAKERAILTAVDLGTDALMVATGGAAGVAGYALGAGVKTGAKAGVKYMFNSMAEEDDVLVNQRGWEGGVLTIQ